MDKKKDKYNNNQKSEPLIFLWIYTPVYLWKRDYIIPERIRSVCNPTLEVSLADSCQTGQSKNKLTNHSLFGKVISPLRPIRAF